MARCSRWKGWKRLAAPTTSSTILNFDNTPRDFQDFDCVGAVIAPIKWPDDRDPAQLQK